MEGACRVRQNWPLKCEPSWVGIQGCFLEEAALGSKWSAQAGLSWVMVGCCGLVVTCSLLVGSRKGMGSKVS